jgi:hypothetical protein
MMKILSLYAFLLCLCLCLHIKPDMVSLAQLNRAIEKTFYFYLFFSKLKISFDLINLQKKTGKPGSGSL